mgnify:FL=1
MTQELITTQDQTLRNSVKSEVSAPSIGSSAMLVDFSASVWTGRKKDKRASDDVTEANFAASGMASVHKKLLGDCQELEAIQKFVANGRNRHSAMTMPWSDTGLRLLPTAQYFKYHQAMTEMINEYWRLVAVFKAVYEQAKQNAQQTLGDLFDPDEYPSLEVLTSKFGIRLSYIPLPDSGDFRIDIGNEATEQVKSQYQDYYSTMLNNAMNDVWTRLHKALANMSERLDYSDNDKKKVFRDSLVGNLLDIVELLNVCNVNGDGQMNAARMRLEDLFRGVNADALREDEHLRSETKRTVDEVIKSLPSIGL